MTTSIYSAAVPATIDETQAPSRKEIATAVAKRRHTLANRWAFVIICVAIVLTTLAFGTVHNWAMAIFAASAIGIVCLWSTDALVLRSAQISINPLQWPLVGMVILGLLQLLPLRSHDDAGLSPSPVRSLSLDPYATRLVVIQVTCLLIYFAATTILVDTPERLRMLVRTVTIFGFVLAIFGLTQSFTSDGTRVYWFRQLTQSTAFGPFINRHHFAAYMELVIALPVGLLFSGAIEPYKRPLYAFAVLLMAIALIMTNSRGGIISLVAEILFVTVIAAPGTGQREQSRTSLLIRTVLMSTAMAFGMWLILFFG